MANNKTLDRQSLSPLADGDAFDVVDVSEANLNVKDKYVTSANLYAYIQTKIGVDRAGFFGAAGNSKYYGTDSGGNFGYFDLPSGVADPLRLSDGSAAAPTYSNTTDTGSGIYFSRGTGIQRALIAAGGSEVARFYRDTVSGVSRVGIGLTGDPSFTLDVNGVVRGIHPGGAVGATFRQSNTTGYGFLAEGSGGQGFRATTKAVGFYSNSPTTCGFAQDLGTSLIIWGSSQTTNLNVFQNDPATNDVFAVDQGFKLNYVFKAPNIISYTSVLSSDLIAKDATTLTNAFRFSTIKSNVVQTDSLSITSDGIGVRVKQPRFDLHVYKSGSIISFLEGTGAGNGYFGVRNLGTYAAPSPPTTGAQLIEFGAGSWDGTSFGTNRRATLRMIAKENWTATGNGSELWFQVTPNGTVTSQVSQIIFENRFTGFASSGSILGVGYTPPAQFFTLGNTTDKLVSFRTWDGSTEVERLGVLADGSTTVNSDYLRLTTAKTPANASDTGDQGQIAWDADYIYVCTATNTWKRVAIATW